MTNTESLLKSLEPIKNEDEKYYYELVNSYSKYSNFDNLPLDEYVEKVFSSEKRAYFTICSKETFNNLSTNKNWINSIIYTPLNDHSRPFMKKGDIVFCYRQGQFSDLKEALKMRGIYALGFVASEPKILFPEKTDHNKYGVAILFPFGMEKHLELRNIQLNPITISLTPYNGNRNDALQYIPEEEYYNSLLEQICRKNPLIRDSLEIVLNKKIKDRPLPEEIWNKEFTKTISNKNENESHYVSNHSQLIYYGVPGSGKSHMINKTLSDKIKDEKQREQQVVRVVFHPEYTNADFVGQILPVLNDSGNDRGVEYRFKAGPFSRILKRALKNPDKPYYLIIEEINRGNAAAIFGDLFQLLDRNVDGWSSYPIENLDVNSFLRSESDSYNDKNTASSVKVGNIEFDENTGIRLPPNLSILATMNTSDQNVFTLDNAFQRRWEMKLVENKFDDDDKDSQNQKNAVIEGSSVSWEQFQTKINAKISEVSLENNLSSMVDKRLGCWFVKATEKGNGGFEIKEEDFKNKILKYLWDDAFKFNREVFETAENFEELIKKVNMENPNFGIFKDLDFNENKNSGSNSDANGNEQN